MQISFAIQFGNLYFPISFLNTQKSSYIAIEFYQFLYIGVKFDLILRKKMLDKNVLRKIFGHKKEQVTRGTDRHGAEQMHRTFPIQSRQRHQTHIGE
jgi:hypothetical protein